MEIKWQSIIGHEKNIASLRTLVHEQRVPHALLFCGPDGIGKKRIAFALGAALLCEESDGPCGQCASCQALLADTHPDFYLVLPASAGKTARSIKIEKIREVQSEIARMPILSKRRVVVIEDAHLMNEAAQNCLLKTLEEPTGQVVFILVTSVRASLLDTIQSRCMPVSFGMLLPEEMAGLLAQHGIEPQQAAELAALSDGSVGRALLLQENGGMELRDDAAAFLRQIGQLDMEQFWTRSTGLGELPREKLSEWLMYINMLLRDMLVLYGGGEKTLLYHPDIAPEVSALLPLYPVQRIFQILELVRDTQRRMEANVNLRLLMERFLLYIMERK